MAHSGYISIYADENTRKIFDAFTKEKGISKSTALTEMLEIYMLSTDEELYLKLKEQALNINYAKDMILQREDQTEINDYIFIKLGVSYSIVGKQLNGIEVIKAYMRTEKIHGYTWFSTRSLHSGMAKNKVAFYNNTTKNGGTVKILFAIGMGINDICYSAVVEKIVSSRDEIPCPGNPDFIPPEFGPDEKAKIWFKITNLQEENSITADMLKFRSNDNIVKTVINNSQSHFGYVYIG